jgi:TolB-like protein/DNA-binding winged helix-turn-helix (wHTH) protein
MLYFFGNFALDTECRELRSGNTAVAIQPQVFDLLAYLIENRSRVVSRDDILKAVWDGRIVSESAITTRINAARNALGDTGNEQRYIRTFPKKGVRFVAALRAEAAIAKENGIITATLPDKIALREVVNPTTHLFAIEPRSASSPLNTSPPHLSIVVLPFSNIGADLEQEYFADGITENLTTDLSRIAGCFVIARNSAFSYKGKSIDVRQVGRELNVRYVLEGSVQQNGNHLRVNVQLVDAETGTYLWAERFDKAVADLFIMQDEIVSRLANTLNAELVAAEARRAEYTPVPVSMDLYFRGSAILNKGPSPDNLTHAHEFFERALALDPQNIEALVGAASVEAQRGAYFVADNRHAHLAIAEATLGKVLYAAPNHAMAHCLLGLVQIFTNRADQGIAQCQRALLLDRNLAIAHGFIGAAKYFSGRGEETERHIQEAFRLSPIDTSAYLWLGWLGNAKSELGADDEAAIWYRKGIEANRNFAGNHFFLAAALSSLGKFEEATAAAKEGLKINPGFTICRFRLSVSSDNPIYLACRERMYSGMLKVGVPEE